MRALAVYSTPMTGIQAPTLGRSAWRGARIAVVFLLAVPGIIFVVMALVEHFISIRPFSNYQAQDDWTTISLVDMFFIIYTWPVTVPLMWWAFLSVRARSSRALNSAIWTIVTTATVGSVWCSRLGS